LGSETIVVKPSFTYLLLIPPAVFLGCWLAPVFGFEDYLIYEIGAMSAAVCSSYWILLFLIIHGGLRGWRGVRVYIIAFVILNFAGIFFGQIQDPMQFTELGVQLAGAAVMCWLFSAVFWPTNANRKKGRSQPFASPETPPRAASSEAHD
jgi:hypothetical protein